MKPFILAHLVLAPLAALYAAESGACTPSDLMPRVEDYTHMWWADGFPSHTNGAPWRRIIQTGRYAMALDTEILSIPHLGAVPGGIGYAAAARDGSIDWQTLPPAELALQITVGGKRYHATAGGKWTDFTGPRLVESGYFLQRADVTNLVFTADDGARLNVEARFETVAWPDRLGLVLAARPGLLPIPAGDACFGRLGGGFGLDGTNHLEIPHSPELDTEKFTVELWAFVPADYQASPRTFPWLVCKNHNEEAEGNYGIVILNGKPQARLNIGGGRENRFQADAKSRSLQMQSWNHIALTYDGDTLRLYLNGELAGECKIGRKRVPGRHGLAIGRRQDNSGDGYHFRGAVDEIRVYDRALTAVEVRERFAKPEAANAAVNPVREWSFRTDGVAAPTQLSAQWNSAAMHIGLTAPSGSLCANWESPAGQTWRSPEWHEVALAFNPVSFKPEETDSAVRVQAAELPGGKARPVDFDARRGWHRVNLDGIEPIVPPRAGRERRNDAIERVKLLLINPTDREQTARLLFEKNDSGFRHRIGAAITGMSAILRDTDGQPTGIPVQLSKNWHNRPEGGMHSGLWFHGFSQVRLPANASIELELTLAYGHWGGVAAASHAQLCLIGWGTNQLWDQSALGSWGESICYEPDQIQGQCSILDVRPVMVRSLADDQPWQWTHNVGGGDFFRFFDGSGQRIPHSGMRAAYESYGPCLTEVTYAGRIGAGITHSETVSLARTDDLTRGSYRLRLDVQKTTDFSRFVLFQIGADTYSYTSECKMAFGNETGLLREWLTEWGGDTDRTPPLECVGRVPWVSLHEAVSRAGQDVRAKGDQVAPGAWANRGVVIRAWQARLGGKPASPWIVEHGVKSRGVETSTLDIVPPPGVTRLEQGDFVEATIEHVVMPQFAADYYGPNEALRAALKEGENTWRMIHREAVGNDRRVTMKTGNLGRLHPAVLVESADDAAEFTLAGGLGYVPVTLTGLTSPRGYALWLDSQLMNQSVHGNDYWQTAYDPATKRWSRTYNIPIAKDKPHTIRLSRNP